MRDFFIQRTIHNDPPCYVLVNSEEGLQTIQQINSLVLFLAPSPETNFYIFQNHLKKVWETAIWGQKIEVSIFKMSYHISIWRSWKCDKSPSVSRESNSDQLRGKQLCYRYTTNALVKFNTHSEENIVRTYVLNLRDRKVHIFHEQRSLTFIC